MTADTYDIEYLDLVDENDNVIDRKPRPEVENEGLNNFRVINAFLINSEKQLWIPRRTAHKKLFPLCLDMSVGGHVESGETYEQAFRRETQEEININIDDYPVKLLAHLKPHTHNLSAFMKVYEIECNQTPDYNKQDFTEAFWLTPQELRNRIEQGEKTKGDLPELLAMFYGV